MDGVLRFTEKSVTNSSKETLASTVNASSSGGLFETGPHSSGAGGQGSSLSVKVENPSYVSLQQQLNVMKSAKFQLEKLHCQALDLKVVMHGNASSDAVFAHKYEDYNNSCTIPTRCCLWHG